MMNLRAQTIILIGILLVSHVRNEELDDFDEATVEVEHETVDVDVPYESPTPSDKSKVYFAEHFDDDSQFKRQWVKSSAKKDGISEDISKYDGEWSVESSQKDGLIGDKGLVLKSKAKHAAIAAKLQKPFVFNTKPLIVQYEVLLQDGQECGGAYLKLLSDTPETRNLNNFHDKTPYTIMFGPDKCGNDHKLHFIFKHKNPKNGSVEEKHCKKPQERIEDAFSDKMPHLYTLLLQPDNTFEIKLDKKLINSGSLLDDFMPPVNPAAEIDDPNDRKPDGWDERDKIPDPTAVKPDDWDEDAPAQIIDENAVMPEGWLENEPTHVPDSDAEKPADWDSDMDGEWEPPLIDNPACVNAVGCGHWEPPLINNPAFKGKWRAPLIDNPNYKGKWKPRRITNPDYFEDKNPFKMPPIGAVGFELWSMSRDILFDNIIITDDIVVAETWATDTFDKKRQKIAKDSESVVQKIANLTNEYPALWAVYILVLGIPVGWILYLCCKPSSKSSSNNAEEREELKRTAEKKKTDEITEDDPEVKDDDKVLENDEEDKEKYSDKDDEEAEEEGEEEAEAQEEGEDEGDADEDDDVEEVENEGSTVQDVDDVKSSKSRGDAPRKRKARKE